MVLWGEKRADNMKLHLGVPGFGCIKNSTGTQRDVVKMSHQQPKHNPSRADRDKDNPNLQRLKKPPIK